VIMLAWIVEVSLMPGFCTCPVPCIRCFAGPEWVSMGVGRNVSRSGTLDRSEPVPGGIPEASMTLIRVNGLTPYRRGQAALVSVRPVVDATASRGAIWPIEENPINAGAPSYFMAPDLMITLIRRLQCSI
jgi:hypothetical protein